MAVWYVIDLMDKNRTLFRQLIHDIAVVNDFAPNVNRRAKGFQRNLDDVNSADHARAEAARFEQKNPLLIGRSLVMGAIGDGIKRRCSHTTIISICQEFTRAQRYLNPRSSSGILLSLHIHFLRDRGQFLIRSLFLFQRFVQELYHLRLAE